ncbi:hypothetical protein [Niabella aurantiaca]|uniref:hypothetical protein n=1 Tax=Niabella aurantiaca TaxID=379900 RepID=UPI00037623C7|nr:hypothetical protein [Niabella aurantiaca]
MLQPLEVFTTLKINSFAIHEVNYLVSQTYYRAFNPLTNQLKIPILLTPYKNKEDAEFHKIKIKNDRYAAIIHVGSPAHMEKVKEMMRIDGRYQLYYATFRLADQNNTRELAAKLFRHKIVNWLSKNENVYVNPKSEIKLDFLVQYGIVYAAVSIQKKWYKMPLDEIEDYSEVPMI